MSEPPAHRAAHKPLTGFGPIGWCAVAVLLGVAGVALTGLNLRYELFRLIANVFGIDALMSFTVQWVMFGLAIRGMSFTVIALVGLPIVAHIYPYRIGFWRWAVVVGWCVERSFSVVLWHQSVYGPLARFIGGDGDSGVFGLDFASSASMNARIGVALFFELGTALVLWFFTRSWRVAAGVALVTIVMHTGLVTWGGWDPLSPPWLPRVFGRHGTYLWYAAVFAILFAWAMHHRRRANRAGACLACGYPKRGRTQAVCTECGAAFET